MGLQRTVFFFPPRQTKLRTPRHLVSSPSDTARGFSHEVPDDSTVSRIPPSPRKTKIQLVLSIMLYTYSHSITLRALRSQLLQKAHTARFTTTTRRAEESELSSLYCSIGCPANLLQSPPNLNPNSPTSSIALKPTTSPSTRSSAGATRRKHGSARLMETLMH